MLILDTDHITILKYRDSERYARLTSRLISTQDPIATTIITVEEQFRGWLSTISRERQAMRQVNPYRELGGLIDFYAEFLVIPFDQRSADCFDSLSSIHIGSMDRKIAAITLVHSATLLTGNKKDFEKVPGLRWENWIDL